MTSMRPCSSEWTQCSGVGLLAGVVDAVERRDRVVVARGRRVGLVLHLGRDVGAALQRRVEQHAVRRLGRLGQVALGRGRDGGRVGGRSAAEGLEPLSSLPPVISTTAPTTTAITSSAPSRNCRRLVRFCDAAAAFSAAWRSSRRWRFSSSRLAIGQGRVTTRPRAAPARRRGGCAGGPGASSTRRRTAAISSVRRSGAMRSSRIDSASQQPAVGQLLDEHVRVAERVDRVAAVADDQRGRGEGPADRAVRARRGRRTGPGGRPRSARGPGGSCRGRPAAARARASGIRRVSHETARMSGSPSVSAVISGVKASAQPSRALSSTGISMTMPRTRSGATAQTSSAMLAPSDVPATTAWSTSRWSSRPTTCSPKNVIE